METNQELHWAYRNAAALSSERDVVMPKEARQLAELAESLVFDDLDLDITMEDIEADLRHGRD